MSKTLKKRRHFSPTENRPVIKLIMLTIKIIIIFFILQAVPSLMCGELH